MKPSIADRFHPFHSWNCI